MIDCKIKCDTLNKKHILTSCKMLIRPKTNTEVSMSYKHLLINERNMIELLNKEGYPSRRIAKVLGFHHSITGRKLKRCEGEYRSKIAEIGNIIKKIMELNNRPIKCLDYQTPFEMFMHELNLI